MSESVSIPGRFNGPLQSGNGGYCAGVLAGLLDGAGEVNLRRPVPLDSSLQVVRAGDGSVSLLDGEELVAEGHAAPEPGVEVPGAVSIEEAYRAMAGYRGLEEGPFCRCFVCGRAREDSLGVFAGAVEDRGVVASAWTPPAAEAEPSGTVPAQLVWAVLDCPTYFAAYMDEELAVAFLASINARIHAPVAAGAEHVVIAWPIEVDGRKRHAGSAVLSAAGEVLAVARALLIEPR